MGWRFFVRRDGNALVPISKAGRIAIDNMKHGVNYEVEPKRRRSEKQNRMFWALMGYIAKSLNAGPVAIEWSPNDLKSDLVCATGRSRDRRMTKREKVRHGVSNDEIIASAERLEHLAAVILKDGPPESEKTAHAIRTEAQNLKRIEAVGIIARPISTSFGSMSADEFSQFLDDAMVYIRDHLAPWITASDDWPEIEKILADSFMLRGGDEDAQ